MHGGKKILNIYSKNDNNKFTRVCNVQCLNVAVYKKLNFWKLWYLQKICRICPHPMSLDDISKPSVEELIWLDFNDVNMALANNVEAMENVPSNRLKIYIYIK